MNQLVCSFNFHANYPFRVKIRVNSDAALILELKKAYVLIYEVNRFS